MAAVALGLGVSRRVECCRCIILHSNYQGKNAAGSWEVFAAYLDGPEEEPGSCENSRHGRAVMSTVVGQPSFLDLVGIFFFFFPAVLNPALADTRVIKSDISDTLGCAREVTSSKAFIIRCMTDLNIYKMGFNN